LDGITKHRRSLQILRDKRDRMLLEKERKSAKISATVEEIENIEAALVEIDASISRLETDPEPSEVR